MVNFDIWQSPSITLAVGTFNQFTSQVKKVHWNVALMVLKFLKWSLEKGILFVKRKKIDITTYSYVDYIGSIDDRRPTINFYIFVGEKLVSWRSKKQTVVVRSNVESKYRAIA